MSSAGRFAMWLSLDRFLKDGTVPVVRAWPWVLCESGRWPWFYERRHIVGWYLKHAAVEARNA